MSGRLVSTVEEPPAAGRPVSPRSPGGGLRNALACLALVSVSFVVVLAAATHLRSIVIYDEATHADYAYRVAHGELPKAGDTLTPRILREWACRDQLPACDNPDPLPPELFPASGLQYNFGHPPLYYMVTGLLARPISSALGMGFVGAARAVGALWLAAGAIVLMRLCVSWGVPQRVAVATTLAFLVVPTVVLFSSFVTNDASAMLCGAVAGWVAFRGIDGRMTWWGAAVIAALVTLTKVLFVAAFVGVLVIWIVTAFRADPARRRSLALASAGVVGGSGVAYFAWAAFQAGRGDPTYLNPNLGINTAPAQGPPVGPIVSTVLDVWPPVPLGSRLHPLIDSAQLELWNHATHLVYAAVPLTIFVLAFRDREARALSLALGSAVSLLSVPVLVQVFAYTSINHYFPTVGSRYGIVIIPMLTLCAATIVTPNRRGELLVWGVFAFGLVCLLTGLLIGEQSILP